MDRMLSQSLTHGFDIGNPYTVQKLTRCFVDESGGVQADDREDAFSLYDSDQNDRIGSNSHRISVRGS